MLVVGGAVVDRDTGSVELIKDAFVVCTLLLAFGITVVGFKELLVPFSVSVSDALPVDPVVPLDVEASASTSLVCESVVVTLEQVPQQVAWIRS